MVGCHKAVVERKLEWCSSSQNNARCQAIKHNQIHLWLIDLELLLEPDSNSSNLELLTEAEFFRAKRIKSDAHRRLYLGGRAGLRLLLSGYSGIVNTNLQFTYGNRGKPNLKNALPGGTLNFNYTLSRGFALYAFSMNRELGVDLEIFPRDINSPLLAKRKLTNAEQMCWSRIPEDQQNDAMLACWTRKEAYGKVLGVGIRYAMNQVAMFTELHNDFWQTKVAGLFGNDTIPGISEVCGVQIELPVQGAASLMYVKNLNETGIATAQEIRGNIGPELWAYQLQ